MTDLYRVLRPFEGTGGRQYQPGETVDMAGARWTRNLVEQRKIEKVPDPLPESEAAAANRGRRGLQAS